MLSALLLRYPPPHPLRPAQNLRPKLNLKEGIISGGKKAKKKKNLKNSVLFLKSEIPFARNRTAGPRMIVIPLQSDALIQLSYKGGIVEMRSLLALL